MIPQMPSRRFWPAVAVDAAWRAAVTGGVRTFSAYETWRRHHAGPSARTIVRHYGSWAAALRAAGHAPPDPPALVIRQALRILWQQAGRPPTTAAWRAWPDRPVALATVLHHYGSWRAALAAAARPDLPPAPLVQSPWVARFLTLDPATLTRQERAIRHALLQTGTLRGAARALFWSPSGLRAHLRRACDPQAHDRSRLTRPVVRHALRAAFRQHGPAVLTVPGWRAAGLSPSVTTITRVYGRWSAAWADAAPCLPPRQRGRPRATPNLPFKEAGHHDPITRR